MARPDAGGGSRILGFLLQHLFEEPGDAVGAQPEFFEQGHAGGVGLALEGAAVAHRQQDVASRGQRIQEIGVAAAHQLRQQVEAVGSHDPLDRMMVHDVADLVRQNARHLRAVLRLLEQVRIEDQDATRQREGVDRPTLDDMHGHFVRIARRAGEFIGQIVDRRHPARAVALVLVGDQLLVNGLAQLDLQAVGQPGRRILRAVVDDTPERRDQDHQRGAERGDPPAGRCRHLGEG